MSEVKNIQVTSSQR